MLRPIRLMILAAVLVATTAASHAESNVASFRQATKEDVAVELSPEGAQGGATQLDSTSECVTGNPRTPRVHLAWALGDSRAFASRIDITKFREGFDMDNYETTGSREGDLEGLAVDVGETGVNYYWRVLTETSGGWVASDVSRFEVPTCPLDMPKDPLGGPEDG